MARIPREKSKTGIYHIILRGINRQTIFEDREDGQRFLETVKRYKVERGYEVYGYCLMGNHIHLILREGLEEIGVTMKRIGVSYVHWYNLKYERNGHLFQGRYKSEAIEDDTYLLTVLRYIHQNPIKANITNSIEGYSWSSYKEYMGKNELVDSSFILEIFDSNKKNAITKFAEFHQTIETTKVLDINDRVQIKDKEAIEIIKEIITTDSPKDVQKLEPVKRDNYLRIIKEKGLSTRQIARITGIPRHIILRV